MSRSYTEAEAREMFLARLDELVRFHCGGRMQGYNLVNDILATIDGRAVDFPGVDLMLHPREGFQSGQIINDRVPLAGEWRKYARKDAHTEPQLQQSD